MSLVKYGLGFYISEDDILHSQCCEIRKSYLCVPNFCVFIQGGTEEYMYVSGMGSLVCGSLAGIGAKIFVYPLDVARKRLQIQGFQHGRKGFGKVYNSVTSCLTE
jgi:hypothetical protein